jgi:hypothetical protein
MAINATTAMTNKVIPDFRLPAPALTISLLLQPDAQTIPQPKSKPPSEADS